MNQKTANLFILVCVLTQFCFGNMLLAQAQSAPVQQLVLPSSSDTFVSTSSSNPNNGGRRFLPIGSYRDYTLPGSPLFASSRALVHFGTVSLPSNAIVQSAKLQLYHYGTNTGDEAFFVSLISSGWNESTVWPGPSSTGDFGSVNLANYNSSSQAVLREIPLNLSIVSSLRTANQGLMLRNYDEAAPGVVVCSRNIPSGPCHAGMEPKLVIDYFLNTAPNPTELGNPDIGWQLGPASAYPGVSCNTAGTGLGCDVSFNTRGADPDDSFPLTTAVEIIRNQGGNASYNYSVSHENWNARTQHLSDGHWAWQARTTDTHGAVGGWSVSKSFVVDTTAPSQPELLAEPEYSLGTQNTVVSTSSVDTLIGSVSYEFQVSPDPAFASILASSGWIDTAEFTFANLENEQIYYYRVRARDRLANTTGWSASVSSRQDAVLPLLQNLSLSEQVISPKNADGDRDNSELSFEVVETHLSGTTVKMQNIANGEVVREFTSTSPAVVQILDGRDANGEWIADGAYKLVIEASDLAGNVANDDSLILLIDNEPPFFSIARPTDGYWTNATEVELSGITETTASVDVSNLANGVTKQLNIDPATGTFLDTLEIALGENILEFQIRDASGNMRVEELRVRKETSAPELRSIAPADLSNNPLPVVTLGLEDLGYNGLVSGVDPGSVYLALDNGGEVVLVNNGQNVSTFGEFSHDCAEGKPECSVVYTFTQALQPDGEYTIHYSLRDYAGNALSGESNWLLDSHTALDVTEPQANAFFNHSDIELRGTAEHGATLKIEGAVDTVEFVIDPAVSNEDYMIENCRVENSIEICDWSVSQFNLQANTDPDVDQSNTLVFTVTDVAGNTLQNEILLSVNIYKVSLGLETDLEYFSPNGDGRQDGINFVNITTDGELASWKLEISAVGGQGEVRRFEGGASLPGELYWDGKGTDGAYVAAGDYSYLLSITTTDGITVQTLPGVLYARTNLEGAVVITSPKNHSVTTRGVTNVYGQAPVGSSVVICIDTVGIDGECNFEYEAEVDAQGSFSRIVSLPRLPDQTQTEHIISATARDLSGNTTPTSNLVSIIVDSVDPFVSVAILPAISGVNNRDNYHEFLRKLDAGEPITAADIASLRTLVLRSTVTPNTERVRLRYADYTDLGELPTRPDLHYIGYANESIAGTNDFGQFFQVYDASDPAPCPASRASCTWDFYYPVPYLNGGVYELEFEGKKGEQVQKLSAGVVIDGTLPTAPTIIDINKLVEGEVQNANTFDDKYYVNSNAVVITGVAEASIGITISAAGQELCHTNADAIGLFRCEVDLSAFYADLDTMVHELALEVVASDGTNQTPSILPTFLIVDKLAPEILESTATTWVRSGQSLEAGVRADERLAYAYLLRDHQVTSQLLGTDRLSAIASYQIPGTAAEGRHVISQNVSDLAGNTTSIELEFWIDNTAPDTSAIARVSLAGVEWGTMSGIKANPTSPASGRLLPGYVTRAESLPLTGLLESGTVLEFWQNGTLLTSIDSSAEGCTQAQADTIVDTVIVKSGQQCSWQYDLQLPTETGYLLQVKVKDKAGNQSQFSGSILLYADRTAPQQVDIRQII